MMDRSRYSYVPLSEPRHIRLLTISNQFNDTSKILGTLASFDLDKAPPYTALSYTWGDPDERSDIVLEPGNNTLAVTKNCYSALLRLRTCHAEPNQTACYFWIDAICINQCDMNERNSQVAMMADIYQSASLVVIDVGEVEEFESVNLALNCITGLEESENDDELIVLPFDLGTKVRDSVDNFYQRAWFKRMWILQEAFMAKAAVVMCGTRTEPWEKFRIKRFWLDTHSAFGKILVSLPAVTPNFPAPFVMIQGSKEKRRYTVQEDLLALLCHSRICRAGEPRDKVFALYGFFTDAAEKGFYADYSNTNTKAAVYIKTTKWLLTHCGLTVLSCVWGSPEERDASLPSWVPDWANWSVRPEWHFGIRIRKELMSDVDAVFWPTAASRNTRPCISFNEDLSAAPKLIVRGFVADRIQRTGDILEREDQNVSQLAVENRKRSGLSKITYDRDPQPNMRGLPPWMSEYGLTAKLNCAGSEEDINLVYHHIVRGRSLAVTELGYFGPVPEGTREGDCICILLGAGVPFVMRSEQDHWRLVGESYIYGLMAGEALEGKNLASAESKVAQHPFIDFTVS